MGYYHRDQWFALPATARKRLRHPVQKVVVSYYTDTPICWSWAFCEEVVKELQTVCIKEKGMDDIPYNFLIGADQEVYEGRGWKVRSDKGLAFKRFWKTRLDIAFIGDWTKSEPTRKMCDLCASLIDYGVEMKYIAEDYDLLLSKKKKTLFAESNIIGSRISKRNTESELSIIKPPTNKSNSKQTSAKVDW